MQQPTPPPARVAAGAPLKTSYAGKAAPGEEPACGVADKSIPDDDPSDEGADTDDEILDCQSDLGDWEPSPRCRSALQRSLSVKQRAGQHQ